MRLYTWDGIIFGTLYKTRVNATNKNDVSIHKKL